MPSSIQSALFSAGPQAARIEWLWWLMFWVCTAVFVAVMIALAWAIARGASARTPADERTLTRTVSIAAAVTIVVLIALLSASVVTGRAVGSLQSPEPLAIEITGHQWWWEVRYLSDQPQLMATTANELHIPVGRPVALTLKSADVIHSFWVPSLHGKMDLVPGRVNTLWIQAERPGIYRGQCAEYCGMQHAHMGLVTVAESPDGFERWLTAQRATAAPPSTPEQSRGRDVFERGPCAMCHTIRGTSAAAVLGPDLTHVASRGTIAAGRAPNTRGYLAGWIADPQQLKPGNRMPATGLSPEDLQALVAYLETLR